MNEDLREKISDIVMSASGGVTDMAKKETDSILQLFEQENKKLVNEARNSVDSIVCSSCESINEYCSLCGARFEAQLSKEVNNASSSNNLPNSPKSKRVDKYNPYKNVEVPASYYNSILPKKLVGDNPSNRKEVI